MVAIHVRRPQDLEFCIRKFKMMSVEVLDELKERKFYMKPSQLRQVRAKARQRKLWEEKRKHRE